MNKPERELRELWTAAGVTPERQDIIIAEIEAKARPGAKVGPFTIPQTLNTIEYRGYRVTYESNRFQQIARIYQYGELVGCAADIDDAKRTIDITIEAAGG